MLRVVRAAYRLGNNHDEAIALTSGNVAIVKHGSIKSLAIVELRLEKGGTYSPVTHSRMRPKVVIMRNSKRNRFGAGAEPLSSRRLTRLPYPLSGKI